MTINSNDQIQNDKSQFLKVKVTNLVMNSSYSKEDQFMFFPEIHHASAKLFPRSLNPEIKMVLRMSDVKGKIKIPAAQNIKLSIMNSIFSFECGLIAGVAQEKSLMAMSEFFFKLFLLKRLRKFFQHLKDPSENERTFADVYLGSDIVKTVS